MTAQPLSVLTDDERAFQAAVADVAYDRTRRAIATFRAKFKTPVHLVVAGGVAANQALRKALDQRPRPGV